ncbi:MAG: dienelactone hydrolase family protein [Rhodobiaceae bacterium]|nr:dienelactone hydrolase family protein [Rhodobiaceae bacterium]
MTETKISYTAGGRNYAGTLIAAEGGAPKAAVVLLPDWRGQSTLARDHAAHVVGLGCTVAIADLYGDGFNPTSPDQVGPMVQHLLGHRQEGVAALASCVATLKASVPAGIPLFCLGFSAGGMVALDYGRAGGEAAGIITCSALLKTAAEGMGTRIAAPVLVLQGTEDQVSPMALIGELVAEMDAAGNDARFVLFSQTHHAFDNPEAGTDHTARLCYSPASAKRARAEIATFLTERIEAA